MRIETRQYRPTSLITLAAPGAALLLLIVFAADHGTGAAETMLRYGAAIFSFVVARQLAVCRVCTRVGGEEQPCQA